MNSSTPGSSDPLRVPIGRPSTAVNPMVVATLRPPRQRAHAGAVAEVEHDRAPARGPCIERRQHGGDVLVRQPVEAVAAHARCSEARRQREQLRHLRHGAVKRRVEAGDLRHAGQALEHARGWPRGCAAGAAARAARSARAGPGPCSSRRVGAMNSRPPCTTRCPTPTSVSPCNSACSAVEQQVERGRVAHAARRPGHARPRRASPRRAVSRGAVPSPDTWPRSSRSSAPAARRNVQNLMLEEPAFRTTIASPPALMDRPWAAPYASRAPAAWRPPPSRCASARCRRGW